MGAMATVLAAFNQLSSREELQELRCRYPRRFSDLPTNRRAGPRGLGGNTHPAGRNAQAGGGIQNPVHRGQPGHLGSCFGALFPTERSGDIPTVELHSKYRRTGRTHGSTGEYERDEPFAGVDVHMHGRARLQVDSIVLQPEPWVMTSKPTRQGPEGGGKGKLEVHRGRSAAGCVPINPRIGMADESSAVATHALRHDSSPFWTGTGGLAVGAALIGEFSPQDKRTGLAAICARRPMMTSSKAKLTSASFTRALGRRHSRADEMVAVTHGHVFHDAPPGGELNPNAGEDLGTRLVKGGKEKKKKSPVRREGGWAGTGTDGTVMHPGQKKQPGRREQALEYRRAGGKWRRKVRLMV